MRHIAKASTYLGPVSGGLIGIRLLALLLSVMFGVEFSFEMRGPAIYFLVMFFAGIGLNARLSDPDRRGEAFVDPAGADNGHDCVAKRCWGREERCCLARPLCWTFCSALRQW